MNKKIFKTNNSNRKIRVLPFILSKVTALMIVIIIIINMIIFVPPIFGYQVFDVISGSMEPAIKVNSLIYDACLHTTNPSQRYHTLFHYLTEEGRLAPMLTLEQPADKLMHSYLELPDHYLMDIILQMQYQQTDHSTVGFPSRRACVLMDKHTGKGAFVRFFNDLIENSAVVDAFYYFKKGHFAYAIDPGDLLVQVEELLSSSKTDDKTRSRLEELKSTIDPDDNTYLFVGKIKSNAQL